MTRVQPGRRHSLRLAAVLDLTAAAGLRDRLLKLRGRPCTLDGGGVQRLGGLCLQVLLAAEASWAIDRNAFVIADPSPALTAQLAMFGATSLMSGEAA